MSNKEANLSSVNCQLCLMPFFGCVFKLPVFPWAKCVLFTHGYGDAAQMPIAKWRSLLVDGAEIW